MRSPYKRDTEWHNKRFHRSTSIVLQEAPQLTTPSMFSSNDQPPTPHSPTVMLQLRCYRHPCRPYCCQQAQHPSFCALLTLPRTSSLALPQEPCPSCSILIFGRLRSQTTVVRPFLGETSVQTFLDDFNTVWPSGDLYHNLHIFSSGLFLLGPYSLSKYCLLWERIVFCFRVVSSFVCINLILEWTITHFFLFICSIFFCMYSFDKFSSSLVDSSLQHALDLFRVLCPCQFSREKREVSR